MKAVFTKTVIEADVHLFAGLTGDFFGVHTDESFAAGTRFGGRIAHGAYLVGLLGAAVGRLDPSVWAEAYDVRFTGPVRPGDTVTVELEPLKSDRLRAVCRNHRGEVVLDGEVRCRCLAHPKEFARLMQILGDPGPSDGTSPGRALGGRDERLKAVTVGDEVRLTRTVGDAELALFLAISADVHPVHVDRSAAAHAGVPWRAAPAAYAVGLVSAAMAQMAARVPPPGGVSYRYQLAAEGWLCAGDTVTTVLAARSVRAERYEIEFSAVCRGETGEVVLSGTTVLKVL